MRAYRERGMLVIDVDDNGPGPPATPSVNRPAGHGLENTRARLAAAYDRAATFDLTPGPRHGARSRVCLPL